MAEKDSGRPIDRCLFSVKWTNGPPRYYLRTLSFHLDKEPFLWDFVAEHDGFSRE